MKRVVNLSTFLLAIIVFVLTVDVSAATKPKRTIKDGYYYIYSGKNDKFAIDLAGGKVENKSNIWIYKGNRSEAQKWYVEYLEDGYYKISSSKDEDYVLDIAGGKTTKGTNVQLYKSNNSNAQKWLIKDVGKGYYTIVSKKSKLAIDIKSGKVENKSNIQTWTDNGSQAQKFVFTPEVLPNEDLYFPEGKYVMTSLLENKPKEESSYLRNTLSIDLTSGKNANGTNIQMYTFSGSINQQWLIEQAEGEENEGFYIIKSSKNPEYVLDVKNGQKVRGANIQLHKYNGTVSQQFRIDYGQNEYVFINRGNGLALDVAGGKTANKTNLQTYTVNSSKAQEFELTSVYDSAYVKDVDAFFEGKKGNGKYEYKLLATIADDYGYGCGDLYGEDDDVPIACGDLSGQDYYDEDNEGVQFDIVSTDGTFKKQITSDEYDYDNYGYYTIQELSFGKEYKIRARYYREMKNAKLYTEYTDYIKVIPNANDLAPVLRTKVNNSQSDDSLRVTVSVESMYDYDGIEIYYSDWFDEEKLNLLAEISTSSYTFNVPYGSSYVVKARYYKIVNGSKQYSSYSKEYEFNNEIMVGVPENFDIVGSYDYIIDNNKMYTNVYIDTEYDITENESIDGIVVFASNEEDGVYEEIRTASYGEIEGENRYYFDLESGKDYWLKLAYYYYDGDKAIYGELSEPVYINLISPQLSMEISEDKYAISAETDTNYVEFKDNLNNLKVAYYVLDDLESEPELIESKMYNNSQLSLEQNQYAGKYIIAHYVIDLGGMGVIYPYFSNIIYLGGLG